MGRYITSHKAYPCDKIDEIFIGPIASPFRRSSPFTCNCWLIAKTIFDQAALAMVFASVMSVLSHE